MEMSLYSVIAVVCVVRVGQHAGNQAVNCGEPLDDFEPVMLVDGEAHGSLAFIISSAYWYANTAGSWSTE